MIDMINTMDVADIMTPLANPKRCISAPPLPPLSSSLSTSSSSNMKEGGNPTVNTTADIVPMMINYATRTLQDKSTDGTSNDESDSVFDSSTNYNNLVRPVNIEREIMKEGTSGADAEVAMVPYEVVVVRTLSRGFSSYCSDLPLLLV